MRPNEACIGAYICGDYYNATQKCAPMQIALGRISEIAAGIKFNWGTYMRRLDRIYSPSNMYYLSVA